MRIHWPEAIEMLAGAGATRVDDRTVRIPRSLVEQAIESAPATFPVYDRRGRRFVIGGDEHHHLPGGTMTEVLEYPGWTRRPATLQDVRHLTRIVDALDTMAFALPMVEGRDAPAGHGEILSCAEMLKNTTKFCFACPAAADANRAFVAMAKALAGTDDLSAHPTIGLLATMLPGYEMDAEAAQVLLLAAHERLPIVLMDGAISGAQGPATMAGSLVMQAAESLAALTVLQTARPGSPCLIYWGQIKLDMRTAELDEAGPEFSIATAAGAQLSRRYGIPSYACPNTNAKILDFQAAAEMAETLQAALLGGTHLTVNAGALSRASAASYEGLILHHEMLRSLLRVRRGMTVTDDTLALAVQEEIGIRGDYLEHPHTLETIHNPAEFLHRDLFDVTGIRSPYPDLVAKARARWQQILETHQPAVTTEEIAAIDKVVSG